MRVIDCFLACSIEGDDNFSEYTVVRDRTPDDLILPTLWLDQEGPQVIKWELGHESLRDELPLCSGDSLMKSLGQFDDERTYVYDSSDQPVPRHEGGKILLDNFTQQDNTEHDGLRILASVLYAAFPRI